MRATQVAAPGDVPDNDRFSVGSGARCCVADAVAERIRGLRNITEESGKISHDGENSSRRRTGERRLVGAERLFGEVVTGHRVSSGPRASAQRAELAAA